MKPIRFDETKPDEELAEEVYSTAVVSHREDELAAEMQRFMQALTARTQLGRPVEECLMLAVEHLKIRHQIHRLQHQLVTMDISREMGSQLKANLDEAETDPDSSGH